MSEHTVTDLLVRWREGDEGALELLVPQVYERLRAIARRQLAGERSPSVQSTELVHLAYEQLVNISVDWQSRVHFYALAARMMRRLLVDQARARGRKKRGGELARVTLTDVADVGTDRDPRLADLDDALTRLAARDERKARVVECRFFGGMTYDEIAGALDVSVNTVDRDLRFAKAWLARELLHPAE